MTNDLSRFRLQDLDFGALDREDELYKKARPSTRLTLELGRTQLRILPALDEDLPLTGGFPWLVVWQHGFKAAGKDHIAICPRMHSPGMDGACPFCEEAAMGVTELNPKRQAVANAMAIKFVPAGAKSPADVKVYDTPVVLPWNVPGKIAGTFRAWVDDSRVNSSPFFFDPIDGMNISVVKKLKQGARDPKRDVEYTCEPSFVMVGGKKEFDQGPISTNPQVIEHILGLRQRLSAKIELYSYDDLRNWYETGERPDTNAKLPMVTHKANRSRVVTAPPALPSQRQDGTSNVPDDPFAGFEGGEEPDLG